MAQGGGNLVNNDQGLSIAVGSASDISFANLPGITGPKDCASLLSNALSLMNSNLASIHYTNAGNLVQKDSSGNLLLVSNNNGAAQPITTRSTNLVQAGYGIVAQGGGNFAGAAAKIESGALSDLARDGGTSLVRDASGALALSTGSVLNAPRTLSRSGGKILGENGSGLIGQDGNGLIGQDGNGLIGQDGNGLIGQDGNGLIGQDGNGLLHAGSTGLVTPTEIDFQGHK